MSHMGLKLLQIQCRQDASSSCPGHRRQRSLERMVAGAGVSSLPPVAASNELPRASRATGSLPSASVGLGGNVRKSGLADHGCRSAVDADGVSGRVLVSDASADFTTPPPPLSHASADFTANSVCHASADFNTVTASANVWPQSNKTRRVIRATKDTNGHRLSVQPRARSGLCRAARASCRPSGWEIQPIGGRPRRQPARSPP